MPISAVVDGRIFCTHGGIPNVRFYENFSSFENAVNAIPNPLRDPEGMSSLAWDLMWADPARAGDIKNAAGDNSAAQNELTFMENTRRRTSCLFTEKALNQFLKRTGTVFIETIITTRRTLIKPRTRISICNPRTRMPAKRLQDPVRLAPNRIFLFFLLWRHKFSCLYPRRR